MYGPPVFTQDVANIIEIKARSEARLNHGSERRGEGWLVLAEIV